MSGKATSEVTTASASALMPVAEAAARVNLSAMTIRRRIHSGAWPSGRSGRKLFVLRAFVEELISAIESGTELVNAETYAAERAATRQGAAAS